MLSCKDVSHLASKVLDAPLTWRERWGMWLHLLFCKLCRRYVRDLRFLNRMLGRARDEGMDGFAGRKTLSEQARERLQRAMQDNSRS